MTTKLSDVPEALRSDFDIALDPELMRAPHNRMTEAFVDDPRDIVFTPHNGGHWIISNFEYGREILRDQRAFGSFPIGVPANFEQRPRLIPLESGPDEHSRYRRLLLPVFEPNTIRMMSEKIRARTARVMDETLTETSVDYLWDVAKPIPTGVFLDMMGLPQDMQPKFFEWENGFYRAPKMEDRMAYGQKISESLIACVEEHIAAPKDDIVGLLLDVEVEGERLTPEEVNAICYLLFLAGVDTVATMLGFITRYLAEHQDLYQNLKADPELLPKAVDELIRMQAFINLNRICEQDIEFHGVQFRKGDNIVIPSFVMDRDPRSFKDPHAFNPDRPKQEMSMHHAFGDGPHKCIGMHLAKLEIRIVLEEFMKRVSAFEISDITKVTAHGGTTMGLDALPLKLTLED
ncbi:MAG: cytochrome P450 [Parvibaculales bacterium]